MLLMKHAICMTYYAQFKGSYGKFEYMYIMPNRIEIFRVIYVNMSIFIMKMGHTRQFYCRNMPYARNVMLHLNKLLAIWIHVFDAEQNCKTRSFNNNNRNWNSWLIPHLCWISKIIQLLRNHAQLTVINYEPWLRYAYFIRTKLRHGSQNFATTHVNSIRFGGNFPSIINSSSIDSKVWTKQRVLMHGHQGWNVRHGLCHIYMRYVYIYIYMSCL